MPKSALIILSLLLGVRGLYYLWATYRITRDNQWGAWSDRRTRG
jgi:hypothetical protein